MFISLFWSRALTTTSSRHIRSIFRLYSLLVEPMPLGWIFISAKGGEWYFFQRSNVLLMSMFSFCGTRLTEFCWKHPRFCAYWHPFLQFYERHAFCLLIISSIFRRQRRKKYAHTSHRRTSHELALDVRDCQWITIIRLKSDYCNFPFKSETVYFNSLIWCQWMTVIMCSQSEWRSNEIWRERKEEKNATRN